MLVDDVVNQHTYKLGFEAGFYAALGAVGLMAQDLQDLGVMAESTGYYVEPVMPVLCCVIEQHEVLLREESQNG